jgi:hypothetical protein
LKIQKLPASKGKKQTRENNNIHADILESKCHTSMAKDYNQPINFAYLILTTHLDQQMFLMNHINAIILPQSL